MPLNVDLRDVMQSVETIPAIDLVDRRGRELYLLLVAGRPCLFEHIKLPRRLLARE